jgi:hypothetical protein
MNPDARPQRHVVVAHVRCSDRLPDETYRQVLEEVAGLSAVVQALPPAAALVDLTGTLRYLENTRCDTFPCPRRRGEGAHDDETFDRCDVCHMFESSRCGARCFLSAPASPP